MNSEKVVLRLCFTEQPASRCSAAYLSHIKRSNFHILGHSNTKRLLLVKHLQTFEVFQQCYTCDLPFQQQNQVITRKE